MTWVPMMPSAEGGSGDGVGVGVLIGVSVAVAVGSGAVGVNVGAVVGLGVGVGLARGGLGVGVGVAVRAEAVLATSIQAAKPSSTGPSLGTRDVYQRSSAIARAAVPAPEVSTVT